MAFVVKYFIHSIQIGLSASCARYERLEDQLNDLTELHQHEMSDLKQELASIEERIAYQAQERARDIQACNRESRNSLNAIKPI